ncbi:GmrSD restriction endonuclease domain-containing protein [Ferviditalea candida]|uniref:DUF262 and DUF1524 domain-containing protein n=1 Tax=Ferviditalea candida TaxID=3108399 RepID=A0ABU5ZKL2_9BACL|nr:DUF262 and DUF1524 domain-containing protein [Paenibacillaceae bacterium T2]
MNAFKSNIYKYLGGTCQYLIPLYQRTYSWEKEQCARLWSDIVNLHTTRREGHFVGSIVRIDEDSAAGSTLAMIIDGQQRLTTLTLLLVALRDYAAANEDCGVNPNKITDTLLLNQYETGSAKYKLLLTQSDRDALIKKIEGAPIPGSLKSRVLDNYAFFSGQIGKGEITPSDLYDAIGKLQIVDIVLDRQYDDPQAIFESLNSTGMDLKDSDLIRNHLLMGLDSATQTDVYNNIWRPTELLFDYEHQSELLDNFFRDYLTMKLGRIPRKNEVYNEFRTYHNNSGLPIRDLCQDIYSFAKHYSDVHFVRSDDAVLKSLYEDMKAIRMEVAYPFLLRVHDDCDKNLITIEELREIVRLCVSYVLRRAVCDIPTNSLNKTFATMKNDIRQDDYLRSVKAFFILLDSYKEFPNDERFIATFLTRDIYNMNRCRYILGRLENWDNKSVVSLENLTIEHIIPQNPHLSTDWMSALGSGWSEIQKRYLHTIGNLTLTAYNSEMSDSSFTEKLDMPGGFRESALRLNKYIVSQTTWGESQVNERAAQLGEVAKRTWPYPTLSDSELATYRKQDDSAPQYTLDSYDQINAFNKMLFEKLNLHIMNLGTFVRREFKKLYIAYKADTNFVDVVVQKARLRLAVNMKFADVIDPKGICKDITDVGRWGNGDVEVFLDSLDGLHDVMAIIEQAFRLQDAE